MSAPSATPRDPATEQLATPEPSPPVGRAVVFFVLLALIALGPAHSQIFHRGNRPLRDWTMFTHIGSSATAVEYWDILADGTETPLDRFELLRTSNSGGADPMRLVATPARALEIGRQLRDALGPGHGVRVSFRTASGGRWKTLVDERIDAVPRAQQVGAVH